MPALLRGVFLDNLLIKSLAMVLAVSLLLVTRGDKLAEHTVSVPVRVSYPDDRVLVSHAVDKVKVTVRGPYSLIENLSALPELEVRLSGFEGEQYTFDHGMVKLPPGLTVARITPPVMLVAFETKEQRLMTIRVDTQGEPDRGFLLKSASVRPNSVRVQGAASAVSKLEVKTSPVSLSGRGQSTEVRVTLDAPPKHVAYLHGNQEYWAHLEIEERRETKVFKERLIEVRNLEAGSPGYEVSPPTVDITLEGPVRLLDQLEPEALVAFVDASGARARKVLKSQRVAFSPPPGLVFRALEPTRVTLLKREPPPPDAGAEVGDGAVDGGGADAEPADAGPP